MERIFYFLNFVDLVE